MRVLGGDRLPRGPHRAVDADRRDRDLVAAIGRAEQKFPAALRENIGH